MKRKLFTAIAVILLAAGLAMLIVPRISNRVGEQIAHTTVEDFKALKSKSTYDEPTEKKLNGMDSTKSMQDIEQEFTDDVRSFIEDIVDNDVDNLRSPFFENEQYDNRLDDFRRNYADFIATKMFLSGDSTDDVKFQCGYYLERFSNAAMLRYMRYPGATVEEAATSYWQG